MRIVNFITRVAAHRYLITGRNGSCVTDIATTTANVSDILAWQSYTSPLFELKWSDVRIRSTAAVRCSHCHCRWCFRSSFARAVARWSSFRIEPRPSFDLLRTSSATLITTTAVAFVTLPVVCVSLGSDRLPSSCRLCRTSRLRQLLARLDFLEAQVDIQTSRNALAIRTTIVDNGR